MIKDILGMSSWFMYNKIIANYYGVDEAIILGCLCNKALYFKDEKEFFCTQEYLIEDTCLTEYRLRNGLQNLKDKGAINIIKKGLPAKNYYSINEDAISVVIFRTTSGVKIDTTGDSKIDTTGDSKIDTTYNNNKENKNKKENNNKDNNIVSQIIDYLNQVLKTHYKNSESTCKHIRARLNEGYTFNDFKIVIDKKYNEWKNTEMQKYLRPETLFGNKFDAYLNQKVGNKRIVPVSSSINQKVEETKEGQDILGDILCGS